MLVNTSYANANSGGGGAFDLLNVAAGEYTNLYEPSSRDTYTTLTKDAEVSINIAMRPYLNNEKVDRGLLTFKVKYPMLLDATAYSTLYIAIPYDKEKEYSGKTEVSAIISPSGYTYTFNYRTKMTSATTITLYITASGNFNSSSAPSIYDVPNQYSIYTYE